MYILCLFGTLFFTLGWIFIRTTWTLVGCLVCLFLSYVIDKIRQERS